MLKIKGKGAGGGGGGEGEVFFNKKIYISLKSQKSAKNIGSIGNVEGEANYLCSRA